MSEQHGTCKLYKYADARQKVLFKKFASNHFLSSEQNLDHFLQWMTFFRRNLHRVATDYLGLPLHPYEIIAVYLMGIERRTVLVASRSAAKSLILAIYAVCLCIVRPGSKVVLSSGSKGQARLIISAKIKTELMTRSPMLRREIRNIIDNQNESCVYFKNGSTITAILAKDTKRGNRSTCLAREEFRQISKQIEDGVLAPFQILRTPPYMLDPFYGNIKELQEESIDIYIGSSWLDDGKHWMWGIVDQAYEDMMAGQDVVLLAFDESVILKHKIKSMAYMLSEKKKQDPLTWRIEFLNERVKEGTSTFFTYDMLHKNQRVTKVFYPRQSLDARTNKKNAHDIARQLGEIRLVSCDMAFVENGKNDNSCFSCIRLLPEHLNYTRDDASIVNVSNGYRRIVPYLISSPGGDTAKQALKIRQLFEDFQADYLVLDIRNAGIAIYDMLARVMYDDERDCEYAPLSCMNDDKIANRVWTPGAKPCIFAISASQKLNSDIALDFWRILNENKIDLLVNFEQASEEILPYIAEYTNAPDADTQFFYEIPFWETQSLISETTSLIREKNPQTGITTVREHEGNKKDRYTSVSYGSYFASLLEQDLISNQDEYEYGVYVN